MDLMSILMPALIIGGLGLIFGVGLGIAAKKFEVAVNPLIPLVREALPGANCGGCGFAGCDQYAIAVVEKGVATNLCPVGGTKTIEQISTILGIEPVIGKRTTAFVKCNGTLDTAKQKYLYDGVQICTYASNMQGGGPKSCEFGCLGEGSCVMVCQFDAIHIINGVAVVDEAKCTSCGQCINVCPKMLIEIIPADMKVRVQCNSRDAGKTVKDKCSAGCIACKLCVKACTFDAIEVNESIAHIDYSKCTQCNACVDKCPVKVITKN